MRLMNFLKCPPAADDPRVCRVWHLSAARYAERWLAAPLGARSAL